jgi:hypothetical protein
MRTTEVTVENLVKAGVPENVAQQLVLISALLGDVSDLKRRVALLEGKG